ncbi:hypothetical protein N7516_005289 [Penicillium verrucosum]|uniref:uncharacterized protein n=1 Tax=Penicillium verrucosum TaxID=60171 RepID=UPI00254553C8|nr:uncharacterized protein N7516_005289 [Penicillium verrucosum]KAJ5945121.1 hypothetical protein N7516_005289 [Penicillium verrucosum]
MLHLKSLLTLTLTLTLATSITAINAASTCDDAYNKCVTTPDANLSTCFSDREACRHGQINSPAERSVSDEDGCQDAFNKCRSAPGANISTCVSEKRACDEGEDE